MSALLELAERCEAATGPDRDIDWRIAKALGLGRWPDIEMWPPFQVGSKADKEVPPYTASLDSAMTLVPAASQSMIDLQIGNREKVWGFARVLVIDKRGWATGEESHARTTPLAICAAALRARASLSQSASPHNGEAPITTAIEVGCGGKADQ